MKRYFFQIAFVGTNYSGWQRQPNAPTVQQCIEESLLKVLKHDIGIVGCGRTDAGVHASDFYFHLDLEEDFQKQELVYKLNRMLPGDISVSEILDVPSESHARFDATSREYRYTMKFEKDPFIENLAYHYNQSAELDFNKLQEAAGLLLEHKQFYPFCKSNSDVLNYNCDMMRSEWIKESPNNWSYSVEANRFLRGMVRLIVGMCLNVATSKISLEHVKESMENQKRLDYAWAVPAKGLSLVKINYPYIK